MPSGITPYKSLKSTRRAPLLALLFGMVSLSIGCEKECKVPAGDYSISLTALEGTCPDNITTPFGEFDDTITVQEDRTCRRFLNSKSLELNENCDVVVEFSGVQDASGLRDGQTVIRVECDDAYSCKHTFAVDYSREASP